ncbi:methionine ABC transporter permease [Microbacterium sp. NPDC055910]|uniref:methionine ABC transporter permease n=1 Tax=Microbacterium sp. NPDC055910 TaxID=3345659 RepID=UPI0035DBB404
MTWLTELFDEYGDAIVESLAETGYMLVVSLAAAVLIGLPLGVIVFLTQRGGLAEHRVFWSAANMFINIVRSFPFLLLVVFLIPFTRLVMGTSFGTQAATLPLCFVAVAIYARLVEQILREIPAGISRVADAMGATLPQAVFRVLLPEARSGLVYALTSAAISLLSYSTVLGVVGGGGIGDFAMRYGYQEYNDALMYITILIIIVCVLAIQAVGYRTSQRLDHR